jgi:S1-C subfamily serine protease
VGTGLILDQEGHILTNNHVVADGQRITITLSNGDSFEAELVGGGEAATDTAVILQEMTTEVVLVERPPPT